MNYFFESFCVVRDNRTGVGFVMVVVGFTSGRMRRATAKPVFPGLYVGLLEDRSRGS